MLDFSTSLEMCNSNGYRTPFIFILGSILRTGEQNELKCLKQGVYLVIEKEGKPRSEL